MLYFVYYILITCTYWLSLTLFIVVIFFWSFFFFKQKTSYEMRISDWSSDVCSSDLRFQGFRPSCRRLHSLDRPHSGQRIARQSVVQVNARVLCVCRASLAPLPPIRGNHLVANAFNDLVQFIDALANQAGGFVSRAPADEVAVILESVTGKAEIAVDLVKFQVCLDDRAGAVDPAISAPQCISQLGVCKAATKEIKCVPFVSPLILHSLSIRERCMAMVRRV